MNYDQNNIFAKILRGEAPCHKVYEDEHTLAFMDLMPQMDGHTLVIPKEPAVEIYDMGDAAMLACMNTIKKVGEAVKKATNADGTTIFQHNGAKVGQTVFHVHFHILPGSIFDANAIKGHAAVVADQAKLADMANRIKEQLV